MAAELSADWSTNSNEAINISLVAPAPGGSRALASFNPQYSHALFGEEESIFGYKNLKINLKFNACDMRPNVQLTCQKKFKSVNETEAQDPILALKEFLPKVAFEKSTMFEKNISVEDLYKDWKPPGSIQSTFKEADSTFEVWRTDLSSPEAQQFFKRIQVLVPFFIDGGSLIDLEHENTRRWTLFLLFEVKKDFSNTISPYVFMGCATAYRFYLIHDVNKNRKKKTTKVTTQPKVVDWSFPLPPAPFFNFRARISQFIILPPFQGNGHGTRLYSVICSHYRKIKGCAEITVEDPNESFDDLRDYNDLVYLRTVPDFLNISINPHVRVFKKKCFHLDRVFDEPGHLTMRSIEDLRCDAKIAPRQFWRVLEMQLLSLIPHHIRQSRIFVADGKKDAETLEKEDVKKHKYRLWQLMVKSRLHKHNRDMLMQLSRAERADHLEATANSVEAGFAAMLLALDKKAGLSTGAEVVEELADEVVDEVVEEAPAPGEKTTGGEKRSADTEIPEGEPSAKKARNIDGSPLPKRAKELGVEADETSKDDVEMQD